MPETTTSNFRDVPSDNFVSSPFSVNQDWAKTWSNIRHVRLRERLFELRRLKPGWMNGKGVVPSPDALDAVEKALDSNFGKITESPSAFPTLEGGIQLGWFLKQRYHIEVEIHANAKTGEIGIVDVETAGDETIDFYPSSAPSWAKVARLIEKHS